MPDINSESLETLQGKVSSPIETVSHKPATLGQTVNVSVVREGAGLIGLKEGEDNKEWSGLFNHIMLTARIATFLARNYNEAGIKVDTNSIINTVLLSHSGRRQSDEAKWYPDIETDARQTTEKGERETTLGIVRNGKIPEKVVDMVDSHYVGQFGYSMEKLDTLEKKICVYSCHRNSQRIVSLQERFQGLAQGVVEGRFTQEHLDTIEDMENNLEQELFSPLNIRPEDINSQILQTRWEKYIRRLYINDVEAGIFQRISDIHQKINGGEATEEILDKEFPLDTWWDKYVRELYNARQGVSLHPRVGKQIGIARAINFYHQLETKELLH